MATRKLFPEVTLKEPIKTEGDQQLRRMPIVRRMMLKTRSNPSQSRSIENDASQLLWFKKKMIKLHVKARVKKRPRITLSLLANKNALEDKARNKLL